MMSPVSIATSGYRAVVEREHPELAKPKNAYDKDKIRGEIQKVKNAALKHRAPYDRERETIKKKIRGEVDKPVVGKKGARAKKK
jgi:hypothetical protein